jgi:hypothetical protein
MQPDLVKLNSHTYTCKMIQLLQVQKKWSTQINDLLKVEMLKEKEEE